MSKTLFCHQVNPPGIICSLNANGVCGKGGGIFKCESAREYPPSPPLTTPSTGSRAVKRKDYDDGYKDGYVKGIKDLTSTISDILSEPVRKPEIEEAIRTLKECGILDDNGDIVEAFRDILVKREGFR